MNHVFARFLNLLLDLIPAHSSSKQRSIQIRRLAVAATFVTLGLVAIGTGLLILFTPGLNTVGADTLVMPETTCDDFASWRLVVDHFSELDSNAVEARVLDSNGNRIPCEGMMPRSRQPHDEFEIICDDFQHRDEAERFFGTHDSPEQNLYGLDRDLDGRPCEALPPLDEIRRVLSRLNRLWRDEPPSGADANCGDFDNWDEANAFFIRNGGPDSDPHRLDGDNNGVPCESLPGAPDPT